MKSCRKCFEYAYVFVGGDVRICPWNDIVIGNLQENTLEEIWKGEIVETIRKAFVNEELIGCSERYCPDCINNSGSLEFEKEELLWMIDNMPDTPQIISLAYDERCNHACPSCRHDFFKPDRQYLDRLDVVTKNIEPYLKKVRSIATNGIGDLFVSTEIVDMLSRLEPENPDFSIFIETNGVLFKDNWDKIKNLAGKNITVSVTPNSFDRETYRYLAGRDDLTKFEESMEFISELKKQGAISKIRMIMVIQDSNFRQIPDFIQRCIEYDADDIVLRPIFKWFSMTDEELLYKNVLNPCHPYHKEYLEILENPICKDSRVFNWGFMETQEAIPFPKLDNMVEEIDKEHMCILKNKLNKYEDKKKYIYGFGDISKELYKKITTGNDITDIDGFVVSNKNGVDDYWMGCPVYQLTDIGCMDESVFIIATNVRRYRNEMVKAVKDNKAESIEIFEQYY